MLLRSNSKPAQVEKSDLEKLELMCLQAEKGQMKVQRWQKVCYNP